MICGSLLTIFSLPGYSYLEQNKFGSYVLLAQVQPGLTKNDAYGPQGRQGGHTEESVDP